MNSSTHSSFSLPSDHEDFEVVSIASTSYNESPGIRPPVYHHATFAGNGTTSPPAAPVSFEPLTPPSSAALERYSTLSYTAQDIQEYTKHGVEGNSGPIMTFVKEEGMKGRGYRINEPRAMRPVRVLVVGEWDCLQVRHVQLLRQAKLSFQNVHLVVGVAPNQQGTILGDVERGEVLRHVRYVDEVLSLDDDSHLDEEFFREQGVDYLVYEEGTEWNESFELALRLGKLLPARALQPTGGVSTMIGRVYGYPNTDTHAGGTLRIKQKSPPATREEYNRDATPKLEDPTPEPHPIMDPFNLGFP